tara:strand:- start:907 stop:1809 length:903 start_codon:yes stop_codon:yes gene_type:complete
MNKKIFSFICAFLTSFIWGTGFIAQDMGMDYIGPITFSFVRLSLGFATLLPFFFIMELEKIKKVNFNYNKVCLYFVFIGFLLAYGITLQQYALLYTDVANTAVYTVLYVVLVPFVSYFFFSKKIHWSIWPSILVCMTGSFLLTEIQNIQVRIGDSFAFINAFFWAFHIVFISRLIKIFNFPFTIAAFQCFFGAILLLVPMLIFEEFVFVKILLEWKELLYIGVLSSGVAFLLQVYSQQNLNPVPVAIIFTMEGVWAAFFGWIILDQFLNEIKIFGIILILSAVIFSQLAPIYGKKYYGRN